METNKNQEMLEKAPFGTLLLKLSLPAVVIILIMIIYNIADTFFIGQTGDPNKVAAISLCLPVFSLLSGFGTLFGNGGTIAISIALGENAESKIKNISAFCLSGSAILGMLAWLIIFTAGRPLALFLGADSNTIEYALLYIKVFSFSAPLVLFNQCFGSLVRSDGDGISSMIATMSGTIVNILLDWLFIISFEWDVFGAAFATDIGNAVTTVMLIVIIVRRKRMLIPTWNDFKFSIKMAIGVISLGLPMACSTLLSSVSSTIQNRMTISYGTVALAAQGVAGKVGMLVTMLIMGVCMGIQPAISYNYGARNFKRMKNIVRNLGLFTVAIGAFLALSILGIKDTVIAIFIDNSDVIAYGRMFVIASVIIAPMYAVYQVCQNYLQATGKASYAILVSLLDKGLIFIPVLFVMNKIFGVNGIAFSHAITMVFAVIIAIVLTLRWIGEIEHEENSISSNRQ